MLSKTISFGLIASLLGATGLTAHPTFHSLSGNDLPSSPQPTEDGVWTAVENRINSTLREPIFLENLIGILTSDQAPAVDLFFNPQGEMQHMTLTETVPWGPLFMQMSEYRALGGAYLRDVIRENFNETNIGSGIASLFRTGSDIVLLRSYLYPIHTYNALGHLSIVQMRTHINAEGFTIVRGEETQESGERSQEAN